MRSEREIQTRIAQLQMQVSETMASVERRASEAGRDPEGGRVERGLFAESLQVVLKANIEEMVVLSWVLQNDELSTIAENLRRGFSALWSTDSR